MTTQNPRPKRWSSTITHSQSLKTQERAAVDQALHGVREKSGLEKIKEGLKVLSGDSKARIERAKEKLRAEVKRIAKQAR